MSAAAVTRSGRCATGQHDKCSGYPCRCHCAHPSAINARAAKAVALRENLPPAERRELLELLGLLRDDGRTIRPDGRPVPTAALTSPKGLGDGSPRPNRAAPGKPPRAGLTTPPGLAVLPPTAAPDDP